MKFLEVLIHTLLFLVVEPLYDNPLNDGKCITGDQSIVKLKVAGTPSKICAPKCVNLNKCPSFNRFFGQCITVSKRHLCILSCTVEADCPVGAICYATPQLGLCLYQKPSTASTTAAATATTTSSSSSIKSKDSSSISSYKYKTYKYTKTLNPSPKVPVETIRTHCVDACGGFTFNGVCDDTTNCEYGADCNDCGPRTIETEFDNHIHKVKKYETLNGIAEQWGVRSGALQLWNRIGDPHLLQVDQNIIVTRKGYIEEKNKKINSKKWSRAMRGAKAKALLKLIGTSRLSSLVTMYEATTLKETDTTTTTTTTSTTTTTTNKQCPIVHPKNLKNINPLKIVNRRKLSDMIQLEKTFGIGDGTKPYWWSPRNCKPRNTVNIVIPFRQRESFLPNILSRLHPLLRKQKIRYHIFIIDQIDNKPFNRAKLLNVGAVESSKYLPDDILYDYNTLNDALNNICYIFHDIDLIPTNDMTPYDCSSNKNPRHLSVFVDTHNSKCVYSEIYGGVTSMTMNQMIDVNGYSNLYWGWGGEDDDMSARIRNGAGLKISRPVSCYKKYPNGYGGCSFEGNCLDQVEIIPEYQVDGNEDGIGHYKMVGGSTDSINGGKSMNPLQTAQLIIASERMHEEGLSTLDYKVISTEHHGTYTRIKVEL
jgi:hypothetical protein